MDGTIYAHAKVNGMAGATSYELTRVDEDEYVMSELIEERIPKDDNDILNNPLQSQSARQDNESRAACGDDGSVVTVMFIYGNDVKSQSNDANTVAKATAAIEESNLAYAKSGVKMILQLVDRPIHINFNPHKEGYWVLQQIWNATISSTARLVHRIRNEKKADLVLLISMDVRSRGRLIAGRAFTINLDLYSQPTSCVVLFRELVGDDTVGHELGHIMGLQHARDQGGYWPRGIGFGYRRCTGRTRFNTIMAYSCWSDATHSYSDPEIKYKGYPTGTATDNNALTLRRSQRKISQFRCSGETVPKSPTGFNVKVKKGSGGYNAQATFEWHDNSNNERGFWFQATDRRFYQYNFLVLPDHNRYAISLSRNLIGATFRVGAFNKAGTGYSSNTVKIPSW